MGLELRLYVSEVPLKFVEPLTLPADAPDAQPWLLSVTDFVLTARAGAFKGAFTNENANVVVGLDNKGWQAAAFLRRPLRVLAEIYDGGALYFSGTVQSIKYGTSLELAIEA